MAINVFGLKKELAAKLFHSSETNDVDLL